MQEMISIANAPRDATALAALTRRQLYMLATNLRMLTDDTVESAFLAQGPEQQAQMVLQGLMNFDAGGGAPQPQAQPMMAPQPGAAIPQPQTQYAAPPPQAAPQPQAGVVPPPAAPPMQMAAPQPPPAAAPPPQAAVVPPPAAPPPVPPPMPPQATMPQQAAPPPIAAPMPPPQAAPAAPPPMQPPAQPTREPQTTGDPGNSGSASNPLSQVSAALETIKQSLAIIGAGIDGTSKTTNSAVLLQKTILRVLLTMAELQGIDANQLARQVQLGDPQAVENFIAALGGQQGKG